MQLMPRKLLLAIPAAVLFSSLCLAQTGTIQGDAKGVDGKPLAGATVQIERTDIKQSFKTKTDKKGHYVYTGLGIPGTYNVSLNVDGKEMDAITGVKPAGTAEVNFDLKAKADNAGKAAAASAEEQERKMTPAQKAEFEKKKKDAEAAMAKNKELNDAFNQGIDAETNKNYEVAIQQFEKASTLGPTQPVVWSHLGDDYGLRAEKETGETQQTDLTKASAAYTKAIELDPMNAAYHNNYGLILVKQKKLPEGQAELGKAISLDPASSGKYYYNLGAVLANIGQNDSAGEAFQKSMGTGYTEAYYQYGLVLVGKATAAPDGKIIAPDGTIQAFQKYLELAPNGPNAPAAKDMLTTLGAGIQTSFDKPGAKQTNTKKK